MYERCNRPLWPRLSTSNCDVCRAAMRAVVSPTPPKRKVSNFLLLLLHPLSPPTIILAKQTNIPAPASLKPPQKLNHALHGCDDLLHCLLPDKTETAVLCHSLQNFDLDGKIQEKTQTFCSWNFLSQTSLKVNPPMLNVVVA